MSREIKKILVIKLSALGDFVLALAAMKKIRQVHKRAHITLLTTPPFESLAKACPALTTSPSSTNTSLTAPLAWKDRLRVCFAATLPLPDTVATRLPSVTGVVSVADAPDVELRLNVPLK